MDKKQNSLSELFQGIYTVSTLGLSVIVPVVLCAWLATYLNKRFDIPDWLMLLIVLLGFAAGINSFVSFVRAYLKKLGSKEKDDHK